MTKPTLPPTGLQLCVPRYDFRGTSSGLAIDFAAGATAPFAVPIPTLGPNTSEWWPVHGEAQSDHDVYYVADGDVLFGWTATADGLSLEDASRDVYERILRVVRAHDHPALLRFWNHVGSINEVEDGVERYQRFCVGRYEALEAGGYMMGADLPAASAVGMPGRGVVVYFLAGGEPGSQVENPRQVAAYRYPPKYGPKSPSFSRATIWPRGEHSVLFVSGTASVVGHESVHRGDVIAQLEETIVNLEAVVARAFDGGTLADYMSLKTYIRDRRDYDVIAPRLEAAMAPQCSILYVESDICRKELLLEIEGVAVRTNG